ncbi:MAG: tetratricopeptide repeat protein [Prochloraceae cyanobacterium]
MICCLNPECDRPLNKELYQYCLKCGTLLKKRLRNRYKIVKPIARGGFGKTYLAQDTDKFNELCLVKQLAFQLEETRAINKTRNLFEQEAKQLQSLGEHPQIPTLLAYFEEDNSLYLVQQYIKGQDLLEQLQQQGTFSEIEIVKFLLDILPVLQFVHSWGVIHRDIKPGNIMYCEDDGKYVLIDFGLSKLLKSSIFKSTGTSLGSQGYVAPEQIWKGKAAPASDLFSLGVTCFHLLSGIEPYSLYIQQGYDWVRNWRQSITTTLSPQLFSILDKLLQIDISCRYQKPEQVLEDLQQQFLVVNNPPTSLPEKLPRPKITTYFSSFKVIASVLTLVGGVFWVGSQFQANNNILGNTDLTTSEIKLKSNSASRLYQQAHSEYQSGNYPKAIEHYTQAIDVKPGYAEAYFGRGNAYDDLKDYRKAIADYTEAIKYKSNYVEAYNNRGNAKRKLGDNEGAIEDYNQAIKYKSNYAVPYYNRGIVRDDLKQYEEAIADYTQAIKYKPNYANAYYNRAVARRKSGKDREVIHDYNQAIKYKSNYAVAYNNRGVVRNQLKDYRQAIADYTKAIKYKPDYANAYYNRGIAYKNLGDRKKAVADWQQAAKIYQKQGKVQDHQDVSNLIKQYSNPK